MIISFSNNKGGVLKTSTATNVACLLVVKGYRVALLDLDPQANVSTTFMSIGEKHKEKPNIIDYLKDRKHMQDIFDLSINDKIKPNILFHNKESKGELVVIHGSSEIVNYENDVAAGIIPNNKLKILLDKLNSVCDYVIIDTPPSIGSATEVSIVNSDLVVVPFELNLYSIDGIVTLIKKTKKQGKKILLLPTRVTKSKSFEKNWNDVIELINNLNYNNAIISKTKISHNNLASTIVQNEHIPQVLVTKRLKTNQKFIDEYNLLVNEIIEQNNKNK